MAGESDFVRNVFKKDLEREFPGVQIIKQDPNTSFQGIQDYIILFKDKWAALETKALPKSSKRPNQPYYVALFNEMSFSAFANAKNWNEVLTELKLFFNS